MENKRFNEIYGCNVFNDAVMRDRLPKDVYKSLRKSIDEGELLNNDIADTVAGALKNWAIEKGATHFTHWFQPLNGFTAEKHDSFLVPTSEGTAITNFSGKMLIKSETDASSFPSGGMRAVFEARGYTAWDCTSPAFLKQNKAGLTLCIPTAFCSYNGNALDEKMPLLRSMEAINKHTKRLLNIFKENTKKVITTVGGEQEYFLIDKELYDKRMDLSLTGRTLFGAKPPKGQEFKDHYYGIIRENVAQFMKELDTELWKAGVPAKTKHNEAAPSQHELAPVYTTSNIACDQNQLIMETMKRLANHYNLECLLHEKPFSYINGSGKHNNWSLETAEGRNLLEPGKTPHENIIFLLILSAVIRAVDKYAGLMRLSTASAENDCRLGGYEAPPVIISIFLGEQITEIFENILLDKSNTSNIKKTVEFGVPSLPEIYTDSTDRNRTSPCAFTGNKFEFRMPGSSTQLAFVNTIFNTAVTESIDYIATQLENSKDLSKDVSNLIKSMYKEHKKIIFNGNGYSDEWLKEAKKRKLNNFSDTVSCIPELSNQDSIDLFTKYNVYTADELKARTEIITEKYEKQINVEANTMLYMANRLILPACINYITILSSQVKRLKELVLDNNAQYNLLNKINNSLQELSNGICELEKTVVNFNKDNGLSSAVYCRDIILVKMNELRKHTDYLETLIPSDLWPMPTYTDMIFYKN